MKHVNFLNPFLIGGSILVCGAAGLITTLTSSTSVTWIIFYQLLAGGGIGFCMLSILLCPRAVLSQDDLPRAQSMIQMIQTAGQ